MTTKRKFEFGRRIAPPRFMLFAIVFLTGLAALIPPLDATRGTLLAFDIASAAFLVASAPLLRSKPGDMRAHARENDANRVLLLALTATVTTVILVAVASELRDGKPTTATIVQVVTTLVLAWLFSNTVYALHYAHLFYSDSDGKDCAGIIIPECDEPAYWDFVYFSFTLGMTFQTSDVQITSATIRHTSIGHCLAAFVFNIGVLAFSLNVLGN